MLIEDASHTYLHTLEIMNQYGSLVTEEQYMIIEDTVLHHGVVNDLFADPGAYKSVETYLSGEQGCNWETQRQHEKFIITWNPTGFLKRTNGCGNSAQTKAHKFKTSKIDVLRVAQSQNIYSLDNLTQVTMNMNGENVELNNSILANSPLQLFVKAKSLVRGENVPEHLVDIFAGLFLAKSLASNPANQNVEIGMHDYEVHTPLHIPHSNNLEDSGSTAASRVLKGQGVGVFGDVLTSAETNYVRDIITSRPEYRELESEGAGGTRYFHPLCEKTSTAAATAAAATATATATATNTDCKIWDPGEQAKASEP